MQRIATTIALGLLVTLSLAARSSSAAYGDRSEPQALPSTAPAMSPIFRPTRNKAEAAANRSAVVPSAVAPASHSEAIRSDSGKLEPVHGDVPKLSPPPRGGEAKLLPRPGTTERSHSPVGLVSIVTVVGSLAVVLGLFMGAVWLLRRGMPKGSRNLPTEALQVLGRAPLAGKQQVHLVRCGNKLLLVAISPGSVKTLTEITDPIEVDRLSGICAQHAPTSATAAFRQVFQQFAGDKSARGFLGKSHLSNAELAAAGGGSSALEDDDV